MGRRVDSLHFGCLLFFSLKSLSFLMMNLISGIRNRAGPPPKTQHQVQVGVEALYCRVGTRGL